MQAHPLFSWLRLPSFGRKRSTDAVSKPARRNHHSLEALESRIAPASMVTLNASTHVLSIHGDFVDDGSSTPQAGAEEQLAFTISGGNLLITDIAGHHVTTAGGPGISQVSTSQVSVSLAQVTSDITIDLGTGSTDTLDFSNSLNLSSGANFSAHAQSTITLENSAQISTSGTGTLNITTESNLAVNAAASISTVDGDMTISAGQSGQVSGSFSGILVSGGLIQSTGAGNVTLLGHGGSSGADRNCGVQVNNGGAIMGGTAGSLLSIIGSGGISPGNTNLGITVENTGAIIGSNGGDVSLLGTGGGMGSSTLNYGIYEVDGGTITAGSSGTVTVEGHSGFDPGTSHSAGITLEGQPGAFSTITSNGGLITLKADMGTAPTHFGISIGTPSGPNATVTNPTGSVVLIGDSIDFGPGSGTGVFATGAGASVTIAPFTTGLNVALGGASVDGLQLGLTTTQLALVNTPSLHIGDPVTTGTVTTSGSLSLSNDLALFAATDISISSAIDLSAGHSFSATSGGGIDFPVATSALSVHGSGTIFLTATSHLDIEGGSISSESGDIHLSANQQAPAASGSFPGIHMNGGTVSSTGGNVTLLGTGGDTGDGNTGVFLENNAQLKLGNTGTLSVSGNGGLSTGVNNYGVELTGNLTEFFSTGGNIVVNGTGGGTGATSTGNAGVHLDLGSSMIAQVPAGAISVTGNGGGLATAGHNPGVELLNGGGVSAVTVNITGTGFGDSGVVLHGGNVSSGDGIGGGITTINATSVGGLNPGLDVDGTSLLGFGGFSPLTVMADTANFATGAMVGFTSASFTIGAGTLAGSFSGSSLMVSALGPVTLSGSLQVPTFEVAGGAVTIGSAMALAGTSVNLDATGTVQFAPGIGNFTFGGLQGAGDITLSDIASQAVTLQVGANNMDSAFTGSIHGGGSLTKIGTGGLSLFGANDDFTGATKITAGHILVGSMFALGNTTVTNAHATDLQFISGTPEFYLGGLTGSGSINFADDVGEAVIVHVGNNGADTTFAGNIGPNGTLVKSGNGTLTLTGHNTEDGGTAVMGGVLKVNSDAALGDPNAGILGAGGTLHATGSFTTHRAINLTGETTTFEADAGKTLTLAGQISGGGNIAYGPTGTVKTTNDDNQIMGSQPVASGGTTMVNGVGVSTGGATGVTVKAGANPGEIATIDLSGATKTVALSIKAPKGMTTTVDSILNNSTTGKISAITLGAGVTLGDGTADSIPDLMIAGKVGSVNVSSVAANSIIELGKGLAYQDTYANKPNVTLGTVGDGVVVDVTGDGTAGGTGGGGLGKFTAGSWGQGGTIMTSQGIKSITIKKGDFGGSIEVDPNHQGEFTTASIGSISIPNGSWTGAGMQVEGVVAKFLTKGIATGSVIEAGAFGAVTIKGNYGGSVIADADPSVTTTVKGKTTVVATGKIASVSIAGDFTGMISADGSVGNVTLSGSGRFEGSLRGASVGNVTASSFTGTSATDGGPRQTITSAGSIGNITAKVGGLTDYIIAAGTNLGADDSFDGVNDTFTSFYTNAAGAKLAVQIGNVTIKGNVSGTTLAAGVNPGSAVVNSVTTYGVYGDADDATVPLPMGVKGVTKLGMLKFETGSKPTGSISTTDPSQVTNAFEAQSMTAIQIGSVKVVGNYLTSFTQPEYLADGTIVRLLA